MGRDFKLQGQGGNVYQVAVTLITLCEANEQLGLAAEGIHQAKEVLTIFERVSDIRKQAYTSVTFVLALGGENQLDPAEEAVSPTIRLLPGEGEEYWVGQANSTLGYIYHRKGDGEKVAYRFKTTLEIGSRFEWHH